MRVAKKSAVCACVKDTYIYLSDIGEKSSSFLELLLALFFFVCDLLTESIALSTNQVEISFSILGLRVFTRWFSLHGESCKVCSDVHV